jgi:hypothetical protein
VGVNQSRVDLAYIVVAEAVAFEGVRAKAVDHDVRVPEKGEEPGAVGVVSEVDGEALLAPVERVEQKALTGTLPCRRWAGGLGVVTVVRDDEVGKDQLPGAVAHAGTFDLDDTSAEVSEAQRRRRAGEILREVEDEKPF